jgi:hypothetical protein
MKAVAVVQAAEKKGEVSTHTRDYGPDRIAEANFVGHANHARDRRTTLAGLERHGWDSVSLSFWSPDQKVTLAAHVERSISARLTKTNHRITLEASLRPMLPGSRCHGTEAAD